MLLQAFGEVGLVLQRIHRRGLHETLHFGALRKPGRGERLLLLSDGETIRDVIGVPLRDLASTPRFECRIATFAETELEREIARCATEPVSCGTELRTCHLRSSATSRQHDMGGGSGRRMGRALIAQRWEIEAIEEMFAGPEQPWRDRHV